MAPDNVKHYKSGEMRSPEFIPVEKPGSGDLGSQDFKFDVAWGHFDVAWPKFWHRMVFFTNFLGVPGHLDVA